jgi:sugar/nucleoside kinase (ribokinase family)
VVTDGSRGVFRLDPESGAIDHFPVFPVEAIDPTGAGDAFTAALVARLVANGWDRPNDEDIRFAMAAGALATTRQGAMAALPTRDDLQTFLAAHDSPTH